MHINANRFYSFDCILVCNYKPLRNKFMFLPFLTIDIARNIAIIIYQ